MRVGGEDILVLSVPLPRLRYPEGTTSAEHAIIDAVLQGLTVKEIAEQRGASLRTVTTQLGTIFRKAAVNSQAELIAIMTDDATTRDLRRCAASLVNSGMEIKKRRSRSARFRPAASMLSPKAKHLA